MQGPLKSVPLQQHIQGSQPQIMKVVSSQQRPRSAPRAHHSSRHSPAPHIQNSSIQILSSSQPTHHTGIALNKKMLQTPLHGEISQRSRSAPRSSERHAGAPIMVAPRPQQRHPSNQTYIPQQQRPQHNFNIVPFQQQHPKAPTNLAPFASREPRISQTGNVL